MNPQIEDELIRARVEDFRELLKSYYNNCRGIVIPQALANFVNGLAIHLEATRQLREYLEKAFSNDPKVST